GTQPADGARVAGIHLEGPFFHPAKKGAQPECNLKHPDAAMILRLQDVAQGAVRILSFAPELPGSSEMIAALKGKMVLSAAHTTADYDIAAAAIRDGITHVTHLFNAMPSLLHRDPGLIGAAAEAPDINAELICDGIHVHPAAVRAAFTLFGGDRICLISDAMSACGMPNGNYSLGGQAVQVIDGRATLVDGTLAGSASTLFFCLQQAIRFGIPAATAVKAATANPARVLGLDGEIGRVAPGYRADLLLCDSGWNLKQVYLQGKALEA
ncbi:MAG: N-acetylglucosamine-6-phosphate deacetylase, partial [Clostridia bacterium]|nr:N-acetylglucosamine-6-phosphate deacetylase [Clostridia bacterium]